MKVTRTEVMMIPYDETVSHYCHLSKNLYNEANYLIRQSMDSDGKWIRYNELWDNLKTSKNYKELPSQTAQQILKIVDRNWKAFFESVKEYTKNSNKFLGKPKPPRYKKKNGENILCFTNQQVKVNKGGTVKFSKKILEIKTRLSVDMKLIGARILPQGTGYKVELLYEKDVPEQPEVSRRMLSIDVGVNNLVTAVNNIGENPIIVKGGVVKSINQYYNKRKSVLQSIYDRQDIRHGKKMDRLTNKRNKKINDYFHKVSRKVVNYCLDNNIDTIIIGRNKNWKQEVNHGRRNNQNFVQIPFHRFISMLRYKCEDAGMILVEQEESYTSKCSYLDNEPIKKHEKYMGRRIHRGMFKSSTGEKINADVNGSANILRKAVSRNNPLFDGLTKEIEVVVLQPKCIYI